jgi:hypothetical protein
VSFVESESSTWPAARFAMLPPAARATGLQLHPHGHASRREVERFIAAVYRDHFGAQLAQFMPTLVSRRGDERTCAAAGYRAASEPLFLERYLPQPVERLLSAATGQPIERDDIVEIGHFASQCAGEGRRLMLALARHLVDAGYRWAVITATAELRRLFTRQHLATLPLGIADPHSLGAEARRWGRYYRHAPKVLAGNLVANLARLEARR